MTRSIVPSTALRIGWGGLLVAAPGIGLRLLGGEPDRSAARVLRVLGGRHLIQGGLAVRYGQDWQHAPVWVVDALHGLSAVIFAAFDHRWRRVALADAAVAAGFAAAGLSRR